MRAEEEAMLCPEMMKSSRLPSFVFDTAVFCLKKRRFGI
jgi:hypothetical protein